MSEVDHDRLLTLDLEPVALTLSQLSRVERIFADLIGEVGGLVTGQDSDSVRWYVQAVRSASIHYDLRPQPATQDVPYSKMQEAVHAVASGLALLETKPERPPFFSDRALERAADLIDELSPALPSIKVGNSSEPIALTPRLKANVRELLGHQGLVQSIGTVEGRLETISVHGRAYFNVYDDLTGDRIVCHFSGELSPSQVGQAVGRRVAVSGKTTYRPDGEIVSVQAEDLYVFPDQESLPTADDVMGILTEA